MSNLLEQLNPAQREAVTRTDGPLLVLAGAGTGKTRVITYRVAYLIEQEKVRPDQILSVTFTNKAADEIRQRVEQLVPGRLPAAPWTSTFHSFCARLLRREAPAVGLPHNFAIYDDDDQERVLRGILKELGEDDRAWVARGLGERISRSKCAGRTPPDWSESPNPQERRLASAYARYQLTLQNAHALDFDDLLLQTEQLLRTHSEIRLRWQQRFRYLQVDEYQDTNRLQYELVRLLAPPAANADARNVCVVGDEDQSIYSWRGADYGNIFRFEKDFPGTRLLLLEQNYRSTQPLLNAATALIQHNRSRKGKVLWCVATDGSKPQHYEAEDAYAEAQFVAERLWQAQRTDPGRRSAVLYRTNAQSRLYEEALGRLGVPYRLIGGFSFYKRQEVKDLLAYVRAARHPLDQASLLRIVNVPPRGIGPATLRALLADATERALPLWEVLGTHQNQSLQVFRELLETVQQALQTKPFPEVLAFILAESGYEAWLEEQDTPESLGRLENLHELIAAAQESEERSESLEEFLDRAALVSDADDYDPRAAVTLLTLHSAKGTEFDSVYLVGLEEGLFPHSRALGSEAEIEEERRLCYVGMTRAKSELFLTRARRRRSWASEEAEETEPSRFLCELPAELIESLLPSEAREAGSPTEWRYEPEPEQSPGERAGAGRRRSPRPGRAPRGRHWRPREDLVPHPSRHRLDPTYPLGSTVRHSHFGEGTVLAVDGEGPDRKILVHFHQHGRKKLVEKYAALERV